MKFFEGGSIIVKIHCKIGKTVYFVFENGKNSHIRKGVVKCFDINSENIWFYVIYEDVLRYWHEKQSLGKNVFFSKKKAEKKLEELKK